MRHCNMVPWKTVNASSLASTVDVKIVGAVNTQRIATQYQERMLCTIVGNRHFLRPIPKNNLPKGKQGK